MIEGLLAPWHWIILVVVLLLIFGPSKLPGIASSIGKGVSSVKKEIKDVTDQSSGLVQDLKDLNPLTGLNPLSTDDPAKATGDAGAKASDPALDRTVDKVPEKAADNSLITTASTLKKLASPGGLKTMATAATIGKMTSPTAVLSKYLLSDDAPPAEGASKGVGEGKETGPSQ